MLNQFSRTELLFGKEAMETTGKLPGLPCLESAELAVIPVEALVRSGIGKLGSD